MQTNYNVWKKFYKKLNRIAVQNYNIYLQNLLRRVRMTTLDDYLAGTGELGIPMQELGD